MTTHSEIIRRLRDELGDSLVIMGHHYQSDSVIQHVDLKGDSLELARKVESVHAEHIVFCGVYFMGESAALLAREGQNVYLPEPDANCVMSQMAPAARVDKVLTSLAASGRTIVPLTYVNSSVGVKAVCGKHGGSVCTSANAETMMRWAMDRGDAVLFIPDKNLARNTANRLGIAQSDWHMLDIRKDGTAVDLETANKGKLLLWPGLCAIHARFNLRQIQTARDTHPGITVVVHPECSPEVVAQADAAGSTSFIINYVRQAPEGAAIAIGTEINLVERLAKEYAGRKTIVPLLESSCSHMASVTEDKLSITLQEVRNGTADPVRIPIGFTEHARAALERMLKACA